MTHVIINDIDGETSHTVFFGVLAEAVDSHPSVRELIAQAIVDGSALGSVDRDGEHYQVRVITQDIDADLYDYDSAEFIRKATPAELAASVRAMITDGGRGVISVDGRGCYVCDGDNELAKDRDEDETDAQQLIAEYPSAVDLMTILDNSAYPSEQDWNLGQSTWTLDDGSKIRICGNDVEAIADEDKEEDQAAEQVFKGKNYKITSRGASFILDDMVNPNQEFDSFEELVASHPVCEESRTFFFG